MLKWLGEHPFLALLLVGGGLAFWQIIEMRKAAAQLVFKFAGTKNWDFKPEQNLLGLTAKMTVNNPASTGILITGFGGTVYEDAKGGTVLGTFHSSAPLFIKGGQLTSFEFPIFLDVAHALAASPELYNALINGQGKTLAVAMSASVFGINIPIDFKLTLDMNLKAAGEEIWGLLKSIF